jgi:transcriptional regulator GlxA family with amidase domain
VLLSLVYRLVRSVRPAGSSLKTDRQVAEIATACGYPNLANFNRQFRKLKGTAPMAYRAAFRSWPTANGAKSAGCYRQE